MEHSLYGYPYGSPSKQGLKSSRTLPCGSVANTRNLYITWRTCRLTVSRLPRQWHTALNFSRCTNCKDTLWMTVQLTLGIFPVGKKPMILGTGLGFTGEEHRTFEHIMLRDLLWPYQDDGSLCALSTGEQPIPLVYNQDFDQNNNRIWNNMDGSINPA